MSRRVAIAAAVAALSSAALSSSPLSAQAAAAKLPATAPAAAPAKPMMDHDKMHAAEAASSHGMSAWKELDAYHMLMMATWHPAKDKGDLAPYRAKAAEMTASAKLLAASTPPKGCDTPALKKAAADLAPATAAVADMVGKQASDAQLKTALGALHDKFDVLEEGCKPAK